MKTREFRSELWLPRPREELFQFFSDAGNLDIITPRWLNFQILSPRSIEIKAGTLIDYRLRLRGIPLNWRTRIVVWDPPFRFVDEQVRGPYQQWIHEHTFESQDRGTLIRDAVKYAVPLDWLVHTWLVRPDIERIFAFRKAKLAEKFG